MTSRLDPVEELIERQSICELKAKRDYAIDHKDWELYASLHADDYVAKHLGGPPVAGRAAVVNILRERLRGVTTVHHSHSPLIDFASPTSANGRWAMEDSLFWKQNGTAEWMHGFGYYHEEYVKRDGNWLFKSRRLDRLHVETSPGAANQRFDRSGENADFGGAKSSLSAATE